MGARLDKFSTFTNTRTFRILVGVTLLGGGLWVWLTQAAGRDSSVGWATALLGGLLAWEATLAIVAVAVAIWAATALYETAHSNPIPTAILFGAVIVAVAIYDSRR